MNPNFVIVLDGNRETGRFSGGLSAVPSEDEIIEYYDDDTLVIVRVDQVVKGDFIHKVGEENGRVEAYLYCSAWNGRCWESKNPLYPSGKKRGQL